MPDPLRVRVRRPFFVAISRLNLHAIDDVHYFMRALCSVILALLCLHQCVAQAPAEISPCSKAISEIIARTYPNETSLILNSGRGTFRLWNFPSQISAHGVAFFWLPGPRDLGNYDECQAMNNAHYCLLSVHNGDVVLLLTGLCAPSVCSGQELLNYSSQLTKVFNISIPPDDITHVGCIAKSDFQTPTAGFYASFSFIGVLVLFALVGTGIEYVGLRKAMVPAPVPQNHLQHAENDLGTIWAIK